ncbi:glycerol-3-phosphate 1-O-acyltransferase PlsY [Lichenibacterium dinghuense]|uniref:glycerol-3-phosphate 1-O-acyltransferase PlsY n=1 Tax=Lichenibacterium dinghuense TaxID=2895977 RepID=UPI001F002D0B|nr:glycerol-3-phosphate 1-O-acyltransferase PlsY [Lichenibacterium sp. 6Y81]
MNEPGLGEIAALALGYGLGSIPFGLLITRVAGTADLRSIGSGNIGATNVLRTGRKDLAALTLVLDALKGTAAVLLARWLFGDAAAVFAGVAAFLGHIYPVWLKFSGGKGVATYLGCLIGLWWPGALAFAVVWLAMAFATRLSSAAALVGSIAAPLLFFSTGRITDGIAFALMTLVLWWKHRANLQRLMQGTESRIGAKA